MGFGGQFGYYHDYTGRYLLGHRYYDAYAGRFVTRDPIGYKGGINLYGFVRNNPVMRSDPNGTQGAEDITKDDGKDAERVETPEEKDERIEKEMPNTLSDRYRREQELREKEEKLLNSPFMLRTRLPFTPEMFQRLRILRGLAKSHGWVRRIPYAIEDYGVYDKDGNFSSRIQIRDLPSPLNPAPSSQIPRFDYRYDVKNGQGLYKNPFTGVMGKKAGSHIPL